MLPLLRARLRETSTGRDRRGLPYGGFGPQGAKENLSPPKHTEDESIRAFPEVDSDEVLCCFMPPSGYQAAVRLVLNEGYELAKRAVLDTGCGPTSIRSSLLPQGMDLQPQGELEHGWFFDLQGEWLSIRGRVRLGILVGDLIFYVSFGMMDSMRVPGVLGKSFAETEVKTTRTEKQTVTLKAGTVIRILRDVQEKDPVSVE